MASQTAWRCDYCPEQTAFTSPVEQLVRDHERVVHSSVITRRQFIDLLTDVRRALRDDDRERLKFLQERTPKPLWVAVTRALEAEERRGGATRVWSCRKGRHEECSGRFLNGIRCACEHHREGAPDAGSSRT